MSIFIVILILLLILGFAFLLVLRQQLLGRIFEMQEALLVLKADLENRRDAIPFLLESFRGAEQDEVEELWHQILRWRNDLNQLAQEDLFSAFKREWAFSVFLIENLDHIPKENGQKNMNLEQAREHVLKLTDCISESRARFDSSRSAILSLEKQFPYRVASAIFGLKVA